MRRGYIDWMRGLAVLVMIEAHVLDAWTAEPWRGTAAYSLLVVVGGFGAPLFLFLAGVSVALAGGARVRRGATVSAAAATVIRRGWQIFGLAFIFRLQAWLISGGRLEGLLKVDILNIMGPSIVVTAWMWAAGRTDRPRLVWLGLAAAVIAAATPLVRVTSLLTPLPDPLEWYLRPAPGRTNFVLFPWSGFVFAGTFAGVLIDRARDTLAERREMLRFGAIGAVAVLLGYAGSFLPSPYAKSDFWTSSPAFFSLRVGVLVLIVALAFAWSERSTAKRWSPLRQFGSTSLFIYWIHVEMVYGRLSASLHRHLTLPAVAVAFLIFAGVLLGLSIVKTRAASVWRQRGLKPALVRS